MSRLTFGGLAILLGGSIVLFGPIPLFIVLIIALLVSALVVRPAMAVYLAIALGFTTFPAIVPYDISLGSTTIFLYEPFLLLAALWSFVFLPTPRRSIGGLALFLFVIVIAAMRGLLLGHPTIEIIGDARGMVMVSLSFIVASHIFHSPYAPTALRVIKWSLWFSAGIVLLSSITGLEVTGRMESASLYLTGGETNSDSTRLLTATSQLSVLVLSSALALIVTKRSLIRSVAPFALPAAIIVFLSFSRNSMLALAIALFFAILVTSPIVSAIRGITLAIAVALPLSAAVAFYTGFNLPGSEYITNQIQGFSTRIVNGLDPEIIAMDTSSMSREKEMNYLWEGIGQSPVIGHGLGFAYRPPLGEAGSFTATKGQYYAHNFYLWMTVKAGVVGLAAFLCFAMMPLARSLKSRTPFSIALGAAVAGLMAAMLFAPFVNDANSGGSIAVGLAFGLLSAVSQPAGSKSRLEAKSSHRDLECDAAGHKPSGA